MYRSREAHLRQRILELETETQAMRAELHGLPEVRRRRLMLVVVAVLAATGAALGGWLWMRRPDVVRLSHFAVGSRWTLRFHFNRRIQCDSATIEWPDGRRDRTPCKSTDDFSKVGIADITYEQAQEEKTIVVEYVVDYLFGRRRRRVSVPFDPTKAKVEYAKSALEGSSPPPWVHVRESSGVHMLYFPDVLAHGFALEEVRFGLDDGPLDQRVPFTRRDRPGTIAAEERYHRMVPDTVRSVTVELVYLDGTTAARTFPMPSRGGR